MTLQRRAATLEAAIARTRDDILLVIRFIVPGNGTAGGPRPTEFRRIRCRDQEWHRQEGETEEAFIERAQTEAQQQRPRCTRALVCLPDDGW